MGARLLAAGAATLLGCTTAMAQTGKVPAGHPEETSSVEDVIDIAFDQDRYERMTVPVTIGGEGPYRFFIDTGAQATVVTSRITDDLELAPSGKAMLVAMGSKRLVDTIAIDQLEFADRTLSGLTSPLLERHHIGADGILGLDTLQDMRVLIDFAEGRMSVADAEQFRGNSGYEIVVRARAKLGQMIITNARLDGVKVAVIIDTGAQNSVGNMALLKRLRSRGDMTFSSTDVHGVTIEGDLAYAKRLEIGDMQLTQVPVGFADSPALEALGYTDQPALILGMANLRMFDRVAIDFSSRRVLFDLPAGVMRSAPLNMNERASRIRS